MILDKCFKCGGDRTLISMRSAKPDYASHTEDECIIALNARVTALETMVLRMLQELSQHIFHTPDGGIDVN